MQRCEVRALVNSVNETWHTGKLEQSTTNICTRVSIVLLRVTEGRESTELVETKHGKV